MNARRTALGGLVATLTFAALVATAHAQGPNDLFDQPRYLGYGHPDAAVNTTGGTEEVGEVLTWRADSNRNACVFPDGTRVQSVATHWWWFVGSGRSVTLSTAGSTFDTVLGLVTGSLADAAASCADDVSDTDRTSRLTFTTEQGRVYRVQVGGCWNPATNTACGTAVGNVRIEATSEPPVNDARAAATDIATGGRAFSDNYAATEERGEPLECTGERGLAPYGRTVWFRWRAPAPGRAVFSATGFDTVIAVMREDAPNVLRCDDDQDAGGSSRADLHVTPGTYLLQVGGYGRRDPGTLSDSAQGALTAQVEFVEEPDRDGDGVVNPEDCAPDNAAISPRAFDIPQNGVDEDCRDGDAPYPKLSSSTRGKATWIFYRGFTKLRRLLAVNVPAGATVAVTCRGRSCPARRLRRVTVAKHRRSLSLMTRRIARMRIRPVTTIRVTITRPGHTGRVKAFRFTRLRRDPRERDTCLAPGARRDVRCSALPG